MSNEISYIKVKELISNTNSSNDASSLVLKIKNSKSLKVGIDWEDFGGLGANFINTFLDDLRGVTKKLINFNLSEGDIFQIKNFINLTNDPNEKKLKLFIGDLDDYDVIELL